MRMRLSQNPAPERLSALHTKGELRASGNTLYIYDEIGYWGVTAKDVTEQLDKMKDQEEIHVRIYSPGGSVFEGHAIYSAIRRFAGRVIVHVDSLAASAASFIALAGHEVRIAKNAWFMVHEVSSAVWGTAQDMRDEADLMDRFTETVLRIYEEKTGIPPKEMLEYMKATTWWNAEQALEVGMADVIEDEAKVEAAFDLTIYNNVPDSLKRPIKPDLAVLEKALRNAGLSRKEAKTVLARGWQRDADDPDEPLRDAGGDVEPIVAAMKKAAEEARIHAALMRMRS